MEQYCEKYFPEEKETIYAKADRYYANFLKQMPDLGGKENPMAKNMLDWFTILSFFEASNHVIDGEALLQMKEEEAKRFSFLGKFINGNRSKWVYRLFNRFYRTYDKKLKAHQEKGEWKDSWKVEINPEGRTQGYCFHLIWCPIAVFAKENGYEELLPYLCRSDHYLAEALHIRLIRTKTEALGGDCCDYWYVGDESPVLEEYKNLKKI